MATPDPTPQKTPSVPSGVAELLAAGRAVGQPISVPTGRAPVVILPTGFELIKLPPAELPPLPDHIRQRLELDDAESFSTYVKRFKTKNTHLFASVPDEKGEGGEFLAVFDYHEGGQGEEQAAKRCAHVAVYPCPTSEPWQTWLGVHGKAQKQADFIAFVDANAPDIVAPASADLLELAMNFESRSDVKFASKVERCTGGRQLQFTETVEAGAGTIKVPEAMRLKLPVFEGGKSFDVEARLEWRPNGGALFVTVHLRRMTDVVRQAMGEVRSEIAEATALVVLTGSLTGTEA